MGKYREFITKEDIQLFRQTIGEITPLSHSKKVNLQHSSHNKIDRHQLKGCLDNSNSEQASSMASIKLHDAIEHRFSSEDTISFTRPGLSRKILKQLKQSKYQLDATIDLHGNTIDTARENLIVFIQRCHQQNHRWLLVVHGKGLGSMQQKPILKNHVASWLMQIPIVLAYHSARPRYGGTGALAVLIK